MPNPDCNRALSEPARLLPARIPKPWGEELWFSGVEERGESSVVIEGIESPLSAVLATLDASATDLPLLKILAPSAEAELGDLYFEAHQHKREVYIVTGISAAAWPSGVGEMRFGFSQAARAQAESDDDFRSAYLGAVKRYRAIRARIEAGEKFLRTAEAAARKAMERFINTRTLSLGEVVTVDTWLPHGLRHGVRVVEFQTPSYDRYLLSFGQKAWTQSDWDTERALQNLRLDVPDRTSGANSLSGSSEVARFDDLSIERYSEGEARCLEATTLTVVMAIAGDCRVGRLTLQHEQAALIPPGVEVSIKVAEGATLYSATKPAAA